jgi:hypothetical protein
MLAAGLLAVAAAVVPDAAGLLLEQALSIIAKNRIKTTFQIIIFLDFICFLSLYNIFISPIHIFPSMP